ncbi:uncharacterized protein LOC129750171 [Uranotaenia lowii]|uniref:uncharacterized protein LOC129748989 n=1 Tax=Uranotaenia lowii TaxID=190385 RepID=UPI0024784BA2|nr:uncharacterized protein LOC129748989 [Uranotaenia lowii]XP_055601402.1 uncharacterized protein LOC129750171 [Uranotaenia lowii]
MKLAAVLVVALACATFATAKPTLLTKKILLKKYALPRYISGGSFSLPQLPSLYIPFPFSSFWPASKSSSEPAPTIVYHSLEEPQEEPQNQETHPVPEAEKAQINVLEDINHASSQQVYQEPLSNAIDLRSPVYIAETLAVRHEAPLPVGYQESVHIRNVEPAPGTQ